MNVAGKQSLHNAICIAIMTRFGELTNNPIYDSFGCKVHDLIKDNKTSMVEYEIELSIIEVLEKIRRIQIVNSIEINESSNDSYLVNYDVTSITDDTIIGDVEI